MDVNEARQLAAAYLPALKRKLRESINEEIQKFAKQGLSGFKYQFDNDEVPVMDDIVEGLLRDGFYVNARHYKDKNSTYLEISWLPES